MEELTKDYFINVFDYEPESGRLLWKSDHQICAGKEAGYVNVNQNGYKRRMVHINGKMRMVHRVIWMMEYGEVPRLLDHKDGDGLNNRLDNLRPATQSQNAANRGAPRHNKLGVKGVRQQGSKFHANIRVNYKRIYLGSFDSAEMAGAAYRQAAQEHFGEFAKN